MDDQIAILLLRAVDRTASRTYHSYALLEKILVEQRKSFLDAIVSIVTVVSAFGAFLTFALAPASLLYGIVIAAAAIAVVGYWRGRVQEDQLYALEKTVAFAIRLDELRRSRDELVLVKRFNKQGELEEIMEDLIVRTRQALADVGRMRDKLPNGALTAIDEAGSRLSDELSTIGSLLPPEGKTPSATSPTEKHLSSGS